MKSLMFTLLALMVSLASYGQNLVGKWSGIATAPNNQKITFIFEFEKVGDGYSATMAVPMANVSGIKPKATTFDGEKLLIDGSNLGMKYEGKWNKETQRFEGTYTEGGMALELNLQKGAPETSVKLNRPQEPKGKRPYYVEDVTFENEEAGVKLAGTFTRPKAKGKYPVVILISGSGPQDRNETFATHRPFLVISDYLSSNGIAVLRYDDRGFGKSTGVFSEATTADFASDALSAVNYLKTRKDIDKKNIGLIGHSEGGIIAPMVANQTKDVAFIVSLAGTGISGTDLSVMQSRTFRPFSVPDEAKYEKNIRVGIAIATSDLSMEQKKEKLLAHNTAFLTPHLKAAGVDDETIPNLIERDIAVFLSPWSIFFYQYNPADEYEKLKIPVLSLNGDKDTQVNAKINQAGIKKALEKAGNKKFKIITYENMNHLFQVCETGKMSEYKEIEQTISPKVLKDLTTWVLEQSR